MMIFVLDASRFPLAQSLTGLHQFNRANCRPGRLIVLLANALYKVAASFAFFLNWVVDHIAHIDHQLTD
jgi:hypothetical protein